MFLVAYAQALEALGQDEDAERHYQKGLGLMQASERTWDNREQTLLYKPYTAL